MSEPSEPRIVYVACLHVPYPLCRVFSDAPGNDERMADQVKEWVDEYGKDKVISFASAIETDPKWSIQPMFAVPRSPKWKKVRDKFLLDHPTCAACGRNKMLNVHHVVPFHLDKSLELEESNLIALCEWPSVNCHLYLGHLMDWSAYNPHVREDAALYLSRIKERKEQ